MGSWANCISFCSVLVIQEILFCIRKPSFTKHKLFTILLLFASEFKCLKPTYRAEYVAFTRQPHLEDRSVSTVGHYGNWTYQSLIWKDGIGWLEGVRWPEECKGTVDIAISRPDNKRKEVADQRLVGYTQKPLGLQPMHCKARQSLSCS